MDWLGFSRPNRDFSMGYGNSSKKRKNSPARARVSLRLEALGSWQGGARRTTRRRSRLSAGPRRELRNCRTTPRYVERRGESDVVFARVSHGGLGPKRLKRQAITFSGFRKDEFSNRLKRVVYAQPLAIIGMDECDPT